MATTNDQVQIGTQRLPRAKRFVGRQRREPGAELLAIVVVAVMLIPFVFLLLNSVKPYAQIVTGFLEFPESLDFENYARAWKVTRYPRSFLNSLFVTSLGASGVVLFASMAAYKLARTKTRTSRIIYLVVTFSMLVPFPTIMIPLVRQASMLQLYNKLFGLVVIYWGLQAALATFMIHGFVKGVPLEIEEAAIIDGCGPFRQFFQVVVPLLKPVLTTVAVLNVLWQWNDFLLPMLLLRRKTSFTIPITMSNLWGEFHAKWDVIFPAIIIVMLPTIVFFFFMQKHIVRGVAAGGLKG